MTTAQTQFLSELVFCVGLLFIGVGLFFWGCKWFFGKLSDLIVEPSPEELRQREIDLFIRKANWDADWLLFRRRVRRWIRALVSMVSAGAGSLAAMLNRR